MSTEDKPSQVTHVHLWPRGVNSDCGCYAMAAVIAMCIAAVSITRIVYGQ